MEDTSKRVLMLAWGIRVRESSLPRSCTHPSVVVVVLLPKVVVVVVRVVVHELDVVVHEVDVIEGTA